MNTLLRDVEQELGGWRAAGRVVAQRPDREEAFRGKVSALRIRLSKALYEEPGKAGKICRQGDPGTLGMHAAAAQPAL